MERPHLGAERLREPRLQVRRPARRGRPPGRRSPPRAPVRAVPTGTLRGRARCTVTGGCAAAIASDGLLHPRRRVGGRRAEELQRDVPVLRRDPAGVRERLTPRLDRRGHGDDGRSRHLDREEQPQRRLVGRATGSSATSMRLRGRVPGSGTPSRYRRTRSSPACSAHRRTRNRSPGTRNPRACCTSSGVERDPHGARLGASVRLRARRRPSAHRPTSAPNTPAGARGHLERARLADHAGPVDRLLRRRPGRSASPRPCRRPPSRGSSRTRRGRTVSARPDPPAGERLGARERRAGRPEQPADRLLQLLVVRR